MSKVEIVFRSKEENDYFAVALANFINHNVCPDSLYMDAVRQFECDRHRHSNNKIDPELCIMCWFEAVKQVSRVKEKTNDQG